MLAKKIAYNTIISIGARVIGVALSLVSLGLIARYLGKEDFGSYSLVLAFLSIFNILADLGLYSLMTREISRPEADEKKIASNIFSLRIVVLLISLVIAVLLIWLFPYPSKVKIGVIIGSFSFLFLSSSQVLMGIFQKYLRTDKAALAEVIGRIFQLALVAYFIFADFGFFFILVALVISSGLIFLLNFIFARQHIPISLSFDKEYWKKIIKTTLPIAVSIVLTLIYFKIDSVFLSLNFINRSSSNPIVDVGIYNIAYKVLEGIIFIPSMFVGLIMPLLSEFAFSHRDKFKKIFQKSLDIIIIFAIPAVIGIFFLSSPIVRLIGGENFNESVFILQILSFAIGLIFLGTLFGNSIIALNKQKTGAWIYFSGMLFNIITNLIFIPKYSYLGAAITTVFTEFLVTLLMFILIWKTISYFPLFGVIFKSLFAGLIMGIFIYYFQAWNLFLLIGGGIIIYVGTLCLIKGIRKDELLALVSRR